METNKQKLLMKATQVLEFFKNDAEVLNLFTKLPRYTVGNYDKETEYFDRADILATRSSLVEALDNFVPTHVIMEGKGYYRAVESPISVTEGTELFVSWDSFKKYMSTIGVKIPVEVENVPKYIVNTHVWTFSGLVKFEELAAVVPQDEMRVFMQQSTTRTFNMVKSSIKDIIPEIQYEAKN